MHILVRAAGSTLFAAFSSVYAIPMRSNLHPDHPQTYDGQHQHPQSHQAPHHQPAIERGKATIATSPAVGALFGVWKDVPRKAPHSSLTTSSSSAPYHLPYYEPTNRIPSSSEKAGASWQSATPFWDYMHAHHVTGEQASLSRIASHGGQHSNAERTFPALHAVTAVAPVRQKARVANDEVTAAAVPLPLPFVDGSLMEMTVTDLRKFVATEKLNLRRQLQILKRNSQQEQTAKIYKERSLLPSLRSKFYDFVRWGMLSPPEQVKWIHVIHKYREEYGIHAPRINPNPNPTPISPSSSSQLQVEPYFKTINRRRQTIRKRRQRAKAQGREFSAADERELELLTTMINIGRMPTAEQLLQEPEDLRKLWKVISEVTAQDIERESLRRVLGDVDTSVGGSQRPSNAHSSQSYLRS